MFRKSKSTIGRCGFFYPQHRYFSSYPMSHCKIQKEGHDDKESLINKVLLTVKQHPHAHLTLMSPTYLLSDHPPSPRSKTKGYVIPGHIHSTCTNSDGSIIEEGDVSFGTSGKKIMDGITTVFDSRLQGYQPLDIPILQGKFTSNLLEIKKWADRAMKLKDFDLYILAIPFHSIFEQARYLQIAKAFKANNSERHYSLMSHYHPDSIENPDTIVQANNCVAINRELNENYFKIKLNLGDNPTPQTAYFQLMKEMRPHAMGLFMHKSNDPLLGVHHQAKRENDSLVI